MRGRERSARREARRQRGVVPRGLHASSLHRGRGVSSLVGGAERRRGCRVRAGGSEGQLPRARGEHPRRSGGRRRCSRAILERRAGRPGMVLLRGPTDRERQARDPPRRAADLQGRLSALQDDDRPPGASQGRLGLPRAARRARGREGDRHHGQARHRGVRHRRVQPAVPGVGPALRRRVRAPDRTDRLLDRHVRRVLDDVDRRTSSRSGGRSSACTSAGCSSRTDKVTAYCPRCGTALSDAEVALGYRTVEDPSVFVRFPIVEAAGPVPRRRLAARLDDDARGRCRRTPAWPSTPTRRTCGRERRRRASWSSRRRSSSVSLGDGWRADVTFRGRDARRGAVRARRTRTSRVRIAVVAADFVSMEDGTGIVHLAPAFGPDGPRGRPRARDGRSSSRSADDGALHRARARLRPRAVRQGRRPDDRRGPTRARPARCATGGYEHDYPFCWRCATPLLYYARTSWYVRTTAVKERLLEVNEHGQLVPRPHQARPLRQLAREQRRLGALARAVLGHAAADLAVPRGAPDRDRLARGSSASSPAATSPTSIRTGRAIDEVDVRVPAGAASRRNARP